MYESITYESIMERMLSRVSDHLDKREGSVIWDALAPAAVELQLMYIELDVILKETFGDTASREYLIRRAKERGIEPYPASCALLQGEFNLDITPGSRFSLNELNYRAEERTAEGIYRMRCETPGRIGNRYFGDLIPIEYIDGLEYARLTRLLIPGEDEEETEDFRIRYFASFDTNAYGGNITDYRNKCNALPGVGLTVVTPVWNGGGTVKLTILDSEYSSAGPALTASVQEAFDPAGDAHGEGIAPIGHIVTVDTAEEIPVSVCADFLFESGYAFDTLQEKIEGALSGYLLDIRKKWEQHSPVVRIAQIIAQLSEIEGILDIRDVSINGGQDNLILERCQIPVMGGVQHAADG